MSAPDVSAGVVAPGTLYVVSTPIGNLGDITYRAVEVMRAVTIVVAEDTRHSRTLLAHYGITTPLSAYHEHNEAREAPRLVARMREGDAIAIITDAGTPLVSDPGARLVRAAADAGVAVVPVPGASAVLSALVAAALPADRFTFFGFPPRKGKEREALFASIARSPYTSVLYESPNRVSDTLADLERAGCGDREAVVARELTKRYEEVRRGSVRSLAAEITGELRGEVVIVVGPAPADTGIATEDDARALAQRLRADGIAPRAIVERLTGELGLARNLAYRLAHERSEADAAGTGASD